MRSKKMSPESAAQRGSERQDDRKITCHGQSRGPKSFCQVCSFIASQAATDRNPALTSDVLAEGLVQQSPRPELKGSGLELAVPLGHLEPPETKKSTCMESVGKTAETRMSVRNEVRKKNCQNGSSNLVIILAGRVCLHALKTPRFAVAASFWYSSRGPSTTYVGIKSSCGRCGNLRSWRKAALDDTVWISHVGSFVNFCRM